MISSFEVGAILRVVDEASPALLRISGSFERFSAIIKQFNEQMAGLRGSADKGATGVAAAFGDMDKAILATQERVAALKAEMASVGTGRGGVFARGTHGGGGGSGGPPKPLSVGGGGGFWEMIGGAAILESVKSVLSAGGDLDLQKKLLGDLLGANAKPGDVDGALKLATRLATDSQNGIIGTTPSQNLAGIRELVPFTHDLSSAEQTYQGAMRGAKVLEELTGGKRKAIDEVQGLVKALEQVGGGIDPVTHQLSAERLQDTITEAVKTIVASGGTIDSNALLGFAKTAGGMGRLTTDMPTLFDNVMTAIIDMGGNRSGIGMAALGRQFLGGKMTFQTAQQLEEIGIMPAGGYMRAGAGISMKPGFEMQGIQEIMDPNKGIGSWLTDVWGPAVKAKLEKEGTYDTAHIMAESYKDFGQQTGQRFGLLFLQNLPQVQRDQLLRHGVDPASAYSGIGDKDYAANMSNVGSAAKGFMEVFGSPSVPSAIGGLHLLTDAMHGLTNLAAAHPDIDKAGMGAMFGPALLGNFIGAVKDFDTGIKVSEDQVKAFSNAFGPVVGGFNSLSGALNGLLNAVQGAALGIRGAIIGAISSAFHGAPAPAALPPLHGQPAHPSGLAPSDPHYPGKQSSNGTPVNVKTAIYLDGRVIGQSTSSAFARAATFPTQAASADTYASWVAPDFNTAAG
jgi:hypothetical protein